MLIVVGHHTTIEAACDITVANARIKARLFDHPVADN